MKSVCHVKCSVFFPSFVAKSFRRFIAYQLLSTCYGLFPVKISVYSSPFQYSLIIILHISQNCSCAHSLSIEGLQFLWSELNPIRSFVLLPQDSRPFPAFGVERMLWYEAGPTHSLKSTASLTCPYRNASTAPTRGA